MDNEDVKNRFKQAIEFIVENGYADSERKMANKLGMLASSLNMAKTRGPSWETLLKLCDIYPVSFWWLRSGEGEMVQNDSKRVPALVRKIARLEKRIEDLENRKEVTD